MSNLILKDVPDDLHAQLEREASANFRSVDQEALARLQRSFEAEVLNTERDQQWVDEALASGPATLLTRTQLDQLRDRVLSRTKAA